MTDLDAPLGQSRKKDVRIKGSADDPPAGRRASPPRRGSLVRFLTGGVLAAIAGLNLYTQMARDPLPETAAIALAAPAGEKKEEINPVTGSVGAGQDQPAGGESGVKIVYGNADRDAGAPPTATQEVHPDASGVRISEGGPKVIIVRDPSAEAVGQALEVAHLPEESALEPSEWGDLPARTDDGRRPMDIYARPWSGAGGKRIAIVIGGLGLSQTGTQRALRELPPEITLAFAPEGNSLDRWMREARKKGHELLVQVPMEPFGYPQTDPGPRTLVVNADSDANLDNLRWALGRLTNYTGVVNYLGARFASDEPAISPVLREIGERGLLYLNDGTAGGDRLRALARAFDVPYAAGHVVLDSSRDPAAIRAQLKELEKIAEAGGVAVGSGSAFEPTVETVAAWANDAKKRGFEIVGVAALAR